MSGLKSKDIIQIPREDFLQIKEVICSIANSLENDPDVLLHSWVSSEEAQECVDIVESFLKSNTLKEIDNV